MITKKASGVGISWYSSVYHENAFYIFGGQTKKSSGEKLDLDAVGTLDLSSLKWSLAGKLKTARHAQSVILIENIFIVVGGKHSRYTETCELDHRST